MFLFPCYDEHQVAGFSVLCYKITTLEISIVQSNPTLR